MISGSNEQLQQELEYTLLKWHERFKKGKESVRDDERCGRSKEVRAAELIGQMVRVRVMVTKLRF